MSKITAAAAREIGGHAEQIRVEIINQQCEDALSVIYTDIRVAATNNLREVKYEWRDWSYKGATPKLSDHFPSLTSEIWWWDGAEGFRDHPTEKGSYITADLKKQGFNVLLFNGSLRVSW